MTTAIINRSIQQWAMSTRLYVEALLAGECLADQVWEAWDKREIDDQTAFLAWWLIGECPVHSTAAVEVVES